MIILQAAGWLILTLIALYLIGLAAAKITRAARRVADSLGGPVPGILSVLASGTGLAILWLLTFGLLTVVHALLNPGS